MPLSRAEMPDRHDMTTPSKSAEPISELVETGANLPGLHQADEQHPCASLPPILNHPVELLQKIAECLANLDEQNKRPLAFLAAHADINATCQKIIHQEAIMPFTFDMSKTFTDPEKFFTAYQAQSYPFKSQVRFISFRITNLGLASIYPLASIAWEFYRPGRFGDERVNPAAPDPLDAGLDQAEKQLLATLKSRRKATIVHFMTPSLIRAPVIDKADITVSFDVVQDFSNGNDLPPRLLKNLIGNVFEGVKWLGQRHDSARFSRSRSYIERDVYSAFKWGQGLPENFQTSFFWFAENFLGGDAFFDRWVDLEQQIIKDAKAALARKGWAKPVGGTVKQTRGTGGGK
ncbi:unnamed protein product [Zymoseptoria tritici ST99CH_1E4]|uniref:Uncharacterized protein n=1 Tax=Zymoseptoria tritici ST99CH_1E4 TaxID=1276532 RepID=A0A2H1G4J7_ZYMTR|nr:unnamed protein product [Zymoseptoria tritici ST99CH_1E4]